MKRLFTALLILITSDLQAQVQFTSSDLPIVIINTNGQEIPNNDKIMADMGVIWNGDGVRNYLTDPRNHYNGKIGIELRGSSTLMFPKKGYAVETRDSAGENLNVNLLGFPSENDWVFNATYNDKTLMRDVVMYDAARKTGRYASRSKYFELVLNGEYRGVYILFEKIKQDKNRVDIKGLDPDDITGDAVTGGYLIKVDKLDGEPNEGWTSNYPAYPGCTFPIWYLYHDPNNEDIVTQQSNYIKSFITNFEMVMYNNLYADTSIGFPKIADETSFADFFLVNEFAKNVDGFRLSTYMHKDRDSRNPKLVMGPVWDFNGGLGNANYYDSWINTGWELDFLTSDQNFLTTDQFQVPFWWKKLKEWPRFKSLIKDRWNVLKTTAFDRTRIFNVIDSVANHLAESRVRNFQKWPVLGVWVWPNYYVGQTYQDEITYLKNWITGRLLWMNSAINLFTSVDEEKPLIPAKLEVANYPNPFSSGSLSGNASTLVTFTAPSEGTVSVKMYDSRGSLVKELQNGRVTPGHHELRVVPEYLNISSGFYPVIVTFISDTGTVTTGSAKLVYLK